MDNPQIILGLLYESNYGIEENKNETFKCWSFTTAKVIYTHWISEKWKYKHDKHELIQGFLMATYSIMIVGPIIYALISCHGEWFMILISLGQLSGWGFSIISKGIMSDKSDAKEARELREVKNKKIRENFTFLQRVGNWTRIVKNDEIQAINREIDGINEQEKKKRKLDLLIIYSGVIIVFLSSILGWIGTTGLLYYLYKIEGKIVLWTCIIYAVAILSIVLAVKGYTYFQVFALYFTVSLHIVITCILIAITNGHWIGIETVIKKAISTVFVIGNFLSLVEEFFIRLN
ncbi:16489_t:CDS:2 [Funneliformis geosporum]|uniref:13764_t:CDS:1 n=1 Tax=Funneliformis geosporum TaxID=1117311 RepID=A0A9W4WTU3_9GLOM|nr:16489_t:CDS:2 [Funneliformis geosporum]CAI2186490.1 13764_t:CDS:2 [Funneliformis geosporum]